MKTKRAGKKLALWLLAGCLFSGGAAGNVFADDEYEDFLNGSGEEWFEEEYSDEYNENPSGEGSDGETFEETGDTIIYFDEEIPYDEANAITYSDGSLSAKAVPESAMTLPAGTVLKVRRLTGDSGGVSVSGAIARLNDQKPEDLSSYNEDNTLLFDVEFLRHKTDEEGNWIVRGEDEPASDLDYSVDGVVYRMEETWPDGYVNVSVTFYDMDPAVEVSFTTDKPGVAAMHDENDSKVVLLRKSDIPSTEEELTSSAEPVNSEESEKDEENENTEEVEKDGETEKDGEGDNDEEDAASLPDDVILFESEEDFLNSLTASFPDSVNDGASKSEAEDNETTDTETTDTEATDTEATDTEATDTEATDTEATDTEATDTEATDTEATDTEATDTETTDTEETNIETTSSEEAAPDEAVESLASGVVAEMPTLSEAMETLTSIESTLSEAEGSTKEPTAESTKENSAESIAENSEESIIEDITEENTETDTENNIEKTTEENTEESAKTNTQDAEDAAAGVTLGNAEDADLEAWVDSLPGETENPTVTPEAGAQEETPTPLPEATPTPTPEETTAPLPEETPPPMPETQSPSQTDSGQAPSSGPAAANIETVTPTAVENNAQEGSAEIYINLNLVGRSIEEDDNFTFSLLADESKTLDGSSIATPMPVSSFVTAKSGEALSFGSIHFTKPGTYNYLVMENVPSGASFNSEGKFEKDGVVYDSGQHKVQIKVSETGGNKLSAQVYYDEAETGTLTFTNLYTANTPTIAAREVTAAPDVTSAPEENKAAKATRVPRNSLPIYLLFLGVGLIALIVLFILLKTKDTQ